jgi:ankyrin repeat protein
MITIIMDDFEAFGIREIDWALVEAARNRRWSKVQRIILVRGGNANARDYTWDCDLSILEMAIGAGEIDMVQWLVDHPRADINDVSKDGRTALHTAIKMLNQVEQQRQQQRQLEICRYLVSQGADWRMKTTAAGDTPLHVACYQQQQNNDPMIVHNDYDSTPTTMTMSFVVPTG